MEDSKVVLRTFRKRNLTEDGLKRSLHGALSRAYDGTVGIMVCTKSGVQVPDKISCLWRDQGEEGSGLELVLLKDLQDAVQDRRLIGLSWPSSSSKETALVCTIAALTAIRELEISYRELPGQPWQHVPDGFQRTQATA